MKTPIGGNMARILALVLFITGLVRVWFDWRDTISQADPFRFADIGTVWASIHFGSLQVAQPAIERYIGPWLWEDVVFRILLLPAAPTLFVLAAVFWFFGRRKKKS